jgi:uncharacterized protein (DUF2141 family)
MRKSLSLFWLLTSLLRAEDCPFCASLEVSVEGFKNEKGLARILVVKDEKSFNETDPKRIDVQKILFRSEKIKNSTARFSFPKLQSGTYAYKVFHDENANELLDTTLLGKPTEGICVSGTQDYKKAGAFSFSRSSFVLKAKEKKKIKNRLHYY